ncbi:MAG: hypothetical protein IIT91_03040 [Aeriscardovia sp.]|nr:hypothetical protein [Aeriscardovia sp.]
MGLDALEADARGMAEVRGIRASEMSASEQGPDCPRAWNARFPPVMPFTAS